MLRNCDSSGVQVIVKSKRPCSPVLSTTGRSRTACVMTRAKSPIVELTTGKLPAPRNNMAGRPFGFVVFAVQLVRGATNREHVGRQLLLVGMHRQLETVSQHDCRSTRAAVRCWERPLPAAVR